MNDIAAAAGVSKATVSRVINGAPTVGREVAERVRAAIQELGYAPSQTARSLSLGVSRTVGVLVPDLSNPMFHQILAGLHRAAGADGYRVLTADTAEDESSEAETAIEIRNRADAVVLLSPRMDRLELLDMMARLRPVAVVNRTTGRHAVVVRVDYEAGIRTVARHLRELGHEHLLMLCGPEGSRSGHERLRGIARYREEDPGCRIDEIPCGSGFADGHAAYEAVRASGATAVIAFNDVVALGLLGRLGEEGVDVPGELSVVGFDDIPYARYSSPPLTTMASDLAGIGALAWQNLRAEMDGGLSREPVVLVPELVERRSTGPAPTAVGTDPVLR
ncbi:LacI family DNA-binding transcriptional regulator [Brachybacterium sp. DNPG3]